MSAIHCCARHPCPICQPAAYQDEEVARLRTERDKAREEVERYRDVLAAIARADEDPPIGSGRPYPDKVAAWCARQARAALAAREEER